VDDREYGLLYLHLYMSQFFVCMLQPNTLPLYGEFLEEYIIQGGIG